MVDRFTLLVMDVRAFLTGGGEAYSDDSESDIVLYDSGEAALPPILLDSSLMGRIIVMKRKTRNVKTRSRSVKWLNFHSDLLLGLHRINALSLYCISYFTPDQHTK